MFKASVSISIVESGKKAPQYNIESDLKGEGTRKDLTDFTKAALIAVANQVLPEEQAKGFDAKPVVRVDNVVGKSIYNVNPFGKIEFFSRQSAMDILTDAYKAILERSRVDTGLYKKSNLVAYNSKIIATSMAELTQWIAKNSSVKNGDKFRFINIVPYARRLEHLGVTAQRVRQKTAKSKDKRKAARGVRVKVPNGTYALAYQTIRRRYKANALVTLEFLPGNYLGIENFVINSPHPPFRPMRRTFTPKKKNGGRPYLYPTIVIKIQEGGLSE